MCILSVACRDSVLHTKVNVDMSLGYLPLWFDVLTAHYHMHVFAPPLLKH